MIGEKDFCNFIIFSLVLCIYASYWWKPRLGQIWCQTPKRSRDKFVKLFQVWHHRCPRDPDLVSSNDMHAHIPRIKDWERFSFYSQQRWPLQLNMSENFSVFLDFGLFYPRPNFSVVSVYWMYTGSIHWGAPMAHWHTLTWHTGPLVHTLGIQ